VPEVPEVPEVPGAAVPGAAVPPAGAPYSVPLPVAPLVELPLVSAPPLCMELHAVTPNANASKPAKTKLWCFCFMIDSLCLDIFSGYA
jgi:hypothetical protein